MNKRVSKIIRKPGVQKVFVTWRIKYTLILKTMWCHHTWYVVGEKGLVLAFVHHVGGSYVGFSCRILRWRSREFSIRRACSLLSSKAVCAPQVYQIRKYKVPKSGEHHNSCCPRRDFPQKAKSRGGTLVTRAYIKESTYSWNIQSVCQKKSRFAWTGAARNR